MKEGEVGSIALCRVDAIQRQPKSSQAIGEITHLYVVGSAGTVGCGAGRACREGLSGETAA